MPQLPQVTALYGTFNADMSPQNAVDVSEDLINMISGSVITIPKNNDLKRKYPIAGHRRYLQITADGKVFNVLEDKYANDVIIDLAATKRSIAIVYNVFIAPLANWQGIIAGQLLQMKSYGIFEEADLYVYITDGNGLTENAIAIIKAIVPDAIISLSTVNEFEYPGIKLVYELATTNPERNYIYFHSKGMSHGLFTRSLTDTTLLERTFSHWRKNIQYLGNDGVEKVGLFPAIGDDNPFGKYGGHGGYIWYNFWYATGKYLSNCEEPFLTDNRYYYEDWLGRQKGDDMPVLRNDSKAIYDIKLIDKDFYSSLEALYYLHRLMHKDNSSDIVKRIPYTIKSSLVLYLYVKIKSLPVYLSALFKGKKQIP